MSYDLDTKATSSWRGSGFSNKSSSMVNLVPRVSSSSRHTPRFVWREEGETLGARLFNGLYCYSTLTWLSSRVSMRSSLDLSRGMPVLMWLSYSNSIWDQVTSSSLSTFSIPSSLVALSTMPLTSSSKLCRLRASKSAKLVSSFMMNFTCARKSTHGNVFS